MLFVSILALTGLFAVQIDGAIFPRDIETRDTVSCFTDFSTICGNTIFDEDDCYSVCHCNGHSMSCSGFGSCSVSTVTQWCLHVAECSCVSAGGCRRGLNGDSKRARMYLNFCRISFFCIPSAALEVLTTFSGYRVLGASSTDMTMQRGVLKSVPKYQRRPIPSHHCITVSPPG